MAKVLVPILVSIFSANLSGQDSVEKIKFSKSETVVERIRGVIRLSEGDIWIEVVEDGVFLSDKDGAKGDGAKHDFGLMVDFITHLVEKAAIKPNVVVRSGSKNVLKSEESFLKQVSLVCSKNKTNVILLPLPTGSSALTRKHYGELLRDFLRKMPRGKAVRFPDYRSIPSPYENDQ